MSSGAAAGSSRGSGRSNLTLRILSALVVGAVALALTYLGGMPFRFFAAAVAGLVLYEWLAMRPAAGRLHRAVVWAVFAASMAALVLGLSAPFLLAALGVAFAVALVHAAATGQGAWSAFGIAYAGLPALALAQLRGADEAGLVAILFLYAVVWATDIVAYFVGRSLGGPKLAPAISPGKTWSGAIGGAVGGTVAGVAVSSLAGAAIGLGAAFILALLLSVLSQVGDLFESALKRRCGVKDSGAILPGHGGIMDRVDGLVAAAILLYLLGIVFSGLSAPAALFSR
ncbi:CDP-archaeol synthase [Chelativorans sp.]|uniref:phosphatidate cytidylyltransferase n=1 Tax=Chelativorans sp. TaxID=2203393 RepID=UPI0028126951|nr:CDP-archaeol synthase [Chelativorans sp.]